MTTIAGAVTGRSIATGTQAGTGAEAATVFVIVVVNLAVVVFAVVVVTLVVTLVVLVVAIVVQTLAGSQNNVAAAGRASQNAPGRTVGTDCPKQCSETHTGVKQSEP